MIAFDSCVLIAGIQGHDHRTTYVTRCAAFIQRLQEQKTQVVLPAPAVWEFLAGYPANRIRSTAEVIERRFRVAPLNLRAAEIAGEIQATHGLQVVLSETGKRPRTNSAAVQKASRQHLKVDIAILASAIAAHATKLITDDGKELERFKRWATGWPISVVEVPVTEKQRLLEF